MSPLSPASYFLPTAADEADLSEWSPILGTPVRTVRTNLFGDAFVLDDTGAILMLDRGACSCQRIASSEEHFWRELKEDAEGWQLRSLVDACRGAGMLLGNGQCYAFKVPPVLGGDYVVENVWVAPWAEWFSFTADLFRQIKDLPDGTAVSFKVVD